MISFGLRLAVAGGREALTRLIVIAAAVAVGAGLLLATFAGINAVNEQLTRYAALFPQAPAPGPEPLWWASRDDYFHGEQITRIDVAATGPGSPSRSAFRPCPRPASSTRPRPCSGCWPPTRATSSPTAIPPAPWARSATRRCRRRTRCC
ncbi:hypothetical protein [Paractinoplanes durhamensis]|uniref:hypothetical protein n=1 Tax=Paractinoplanes durhamensis TaxID=113563 RepID=UPI0036378FD7